MSNLIRKGRTVRRIGLLLLTSVFLAATAFTGAHAETVNCTAITSAPYFITAQGVYCLKGNLSTVWEINAITIEANNVVLDLNGFKLGGLGAGPGTQGIGIRAFDRQNITIKNGTIRGFMYGIAIGGHDLASSSGNVVEDIRADQNSYFGILVAGRGNTIRNNQVVATGGTTLHVDAGGISASGSDLRLINNDVTGVTAVGIGSAYGMYLSHVNNAVVSGNRISDIASPSGVAIAMFMTEGNDILVSDNRISGTARGIHFNGDFTTGKYMNNVVVGGTTPYFGGAPAGNTNY